MHSVLGSILMLAHLFTEDRKLFPGPLRNAEHVRLVLYKTQLISVSFVSFHISLAGISIGHVFLK